MGKNTVFLVVKVFTHLTGNVQVHARQASSLTQIQTFANPVLQLVQAVSTYTQLIACRVRIVL